MIMSKFIEIYRKVSGRILYLCGMMDVEKKRENPSSLNYSLILSKADSLMRSEKLFRSSDLTITLLARKTGTNRTYLSKCFHIHNTNYVDYINEYRVKHAMSIFENLHEADKSITEISELSGFPNPRSFSKCFSKKYGKTPSQFKREILAKTTLTRCG